MPASPPVVVCVAPNGARRTKRDHPNLPLTRDEIVRDVVACAAAGARVVHLHARGPDGAHVLDPAPYADLIAAIERAAGDRLLVQVTTEAAGRYTPREQIAFVKAVRPPAISLALRELVPDAASEAEASHFLQWTAEANIAIQYIVYSAADGLRLKACVRRGMVPTATPHALFVFGRDPQGPQTAGDLETLLNDWPDGWPWSVCAFGREEHRCAAAAIRRGGHVRVGFENNFELADGLVAPDNAALVAGAVDQIDASGRRVATIGEARSIYGVVFKGDSEASSREG